MRSRALLFFIILLMSGCIFLGAEEGEESSFKPQNTMQRIDWEPSKSAIFYRFYLNSEEGELLAKKELKESHIELYLRAGNYKFKVQVINKFQKVSAETQWKDFKVLPAIQPIIRSISNRIFYDNQEKLEFFILTNHIGDNCKIYFDLDNGASYEISDYKVETFKKSDKVQLNFSLPFSSLSLGKYSIRIVDISKLQNILKDAFVLKKAIQPSLSHIDLTAGYTSEVYKGINLYGDSFQNGLHIRLENEKDVIDASMIKVSPDGKSVVFSFNLHSATQGFYNLILENPSGLSSQLDNAFKVLSYDIASLLDFSFAYKIAGYFSPYIEKPEFLYTGVQFRFAFGFGNLAFYDKPFLKDINNFLLVFSGFNLFWQSSFDGPANIQAKIGTGLLYADMKNGITDGFYTQKSYTPYVKMGINGLFEPIDKLLIDIGVAATPVIYFDRTAWMVELSIGLGGSL